MQEQRILFDKETIKKKIQELAAQISRDYAGKELVLVPILKGACTFAADLMRETALPVTVEFVHAASYGDSTTSSDNVRIAHTIQTDIKGKHILIVDTIIDTGKTLAALLDMLNKEGPASVATIALLDKKICRIVDVPVSYRGFDIPDLFVVGYGMDFAGRYRNLPYIAVLESDTKE